MMRRLKNKKVVVKTIDFNDKGDLMINGRPALKFRILKKDVEEKVVKTRYNLQNIRWIRCFIYSFNKYFLSFS